MNLSVKLFKGDCLELMKSIPDKSIDLLLTDPPYNISKNNNFKTMKRNGLDFGNWDHKFDLTGWLSGINRIMNDGSSAIIFNAWRNLGTLDNKLNDEGFISKDIFRWIKSNPMPRNRDRRYITDYEFAIVATNKKGKWVFNRLNSTYERPEFTCPIVSGKERFHPTQKPVSLMEHLILRHSNANQTIFDPFMGSGSTGVASASLNRNFIGIELDDDYFKIAKERIENVDVSI